MLSILTLSYQFVESPEIVTFENDERTRIKSHFDGCVHLSNVFLGSFSHPEISVIFTEYFVFTPENSVAIGRGYAIVIPFPPSQLANVILIKFIFLSKFK